MNPLLMHELARVEHASRVASLSAHRRQSTLMKRLRRRRDQEPITGMEEAAPAIEVIGRATSDQAQSTAAGAAPAEMAPPWAD